MRFLYNILHCTSIVRYTMWIIVSFSLWFVVRINMLLFFLCRFFLRMSLISGVNFWEIGEVRFPDYLFLVFSRKKHFKHIISESGFHFFQFQFEIKNNPGSGLSLVKWIKIPSKQPHNLWHLLETLCWVKMNARSTLICSIKEG